MLLLLIPTLGSSPRLGETVASLRQSNRHAIRLAAIAPDSAVRTVRAFDGIDEVISDDNASGLYAALNVGRRWAARQHWHWITWLADDDVVLPGFRALTDATSGLESPGPLLVTGHVAYLRESGERLCRVPRVSHPRDALPLLAAGVSPMNPQGLLYSRAAWDLAGDFNANMKICGDVAHWSNALRQGASLVLRDEEVAGFRLRRGQLSGDLATHRDEFARVQSDVSQTVVAASFAGRWRFRWDNRGAYTERLRALGIKRWQGLLG